MNEGPKEPQDSTSDEAQGGGDKALTLPRTYRRAARLAEHGRYEDARKLYDKIRRTTDSPRLQALAANDLGTLAAIAGDYDMACRAWREAMTASASCAAAGRNLEFAQAEGIYVAASRENPEGTPGTGVASVGLEQGACAVQQEPINPRNGGVHATGSSRTKVAIVSFLFNWPSTGGGIVHTVELGYFLNEAGYDARIFHVRFPAWGLGRVEAPLPVPSEVLEFEPTEWSVSEIKKRFRKAVDVFAPDHVLITDSWNMKPHLAAAMHGYPYLLRFQALECLCPLNNLRLLATGPHDVTQCPRNQLASPDICRRCVVERGQFSGALHQAERELAGVGTPEYDRLLRQALEEAEAVLTLNPLTEAMLGPFAPQVKVVPWGMDPARFPWSPSDETAEQLAKKVTTLFMAAVAGEFIKGFHILHEACRRLWQFRNDFELIVTFDPAGPIDEFTQSVGWVSQQDLPRHYRASDICLVPTIAQEGLSRTSVEAMASGIPVIASRIGGLPSTVADGATGLLFEPGNVDDLARKIATLLDDQPLRRRMGIAGRKRFEEEFTWQTVIERFYKPLLISRSCLQ